MAARPRGDARARVRLRADTRERIRGGLLDWYKRAHRDLPWRRTSDPYRIWLSEAMLQQTRVETVIPYYERFCARFPDVEALATADEQDVLREWAGLGYYARARNLKRAAEIMLRDHDGQVPREPDALAALPGVGPYTVGALRSIAFKEPAAIVDGNVKRVISRLLAEKQLDAAEVWKIAAALVPEKEPDLFNQALMELGALVCTPRSPACALCPVRACCRAARTAAPVDSPARTRRRPPPEVRAVCGLLWRRRGDALLMLRRPSRGLLGGLWEMPSEPGRDPGALAAALRERVGLVTTPGRQLGQVRHVFTHRALTLDVLELRLESGRLRPTRPGGEGADDARWCTPAQASELPLSRLTRKALRCAGAFAEDLGTSA